MTADDCDLLTSLYALRSNAGVIRSHAERQHKLATACKLASIQDEVSTLIEETQRAEAQAGDETGPT